MPFDFCGIYDGCWEDIYTQQINIINQSPTNIGSGNIGSNIGSGNVYAPSNVYAPQTGIYAPTSIYSPLRYLGLPAIGNYPY